MPGHAVTIEVTCVRCLDALRREDVRIKTERGPVHARCVLHPRPRHCRECGCTDRTACITEDGPCRWVEADLCSACIPGAGERELELPHAANEPRRQKRS